MENFVKNYLININLAIIIVLILTVPNVAITEFQINISQFIDDYLFGDIGLVSLDRHFMSKVIANYIIISAVLSGVLCSFINFFEGEFSFGGVIILLVCFIIALYWSVLSNHIVIPPEKPYIRIAKNSLVFYGICVAGCFCFLSIGITTIISLLRKTKSFIELIK
ncbi:hypothetical protein A1D25_02555 [Ursidibacter arcticus]|uniref:hypothetical protein n=1 Tax=Ursidibacter arcticus TaxID=1524965 RepID=UPI0012FB65C5|nr:hypothetical protein [Ursidibacter arcticus]KAE9537739.1 hypothetical protein A1D25_02555 [Ursidibacter arcticus]